MQTNPSKFHFIMVTGISAIQLTLRAATIEQEDCVQLLGVNIDMADNTSYRGGQELFRDKDVPYNLKASKIIIQPKWQSTRHMD